MARFNYHDHPAGGVIQPYAEPYRLTIIHDEHHHPKYRLLFSQLPTTKPSALFPHFVLTASEISKFSLLWLTYVPNGDISVGSSSAGCFE
ncbi:hypothetical protein [Candidatus Doolittlea endobia]|uniref:hypothetical protein n=1 Tax=Candidatus Doolittlea endobia TaxID=1778262 RepID=UPI0013153DEC